MSTWTAAISPCTWQNWCSKDMDIFVVSAEARDAACRRVEQLAAGLDHRVLHSDDPGSRPGQSAERSAPELGDAHASEDPDDCGLRPRPVATRAGRRLRGPVLRGAPFGGAVPGTERRRWGPAPRAQPRRGC